MVQHLYICLTLAEDKDEDTVNQTHLPPFSGDPGVLSAFCSLAESDHSRTRASVAQILTDLSGAFQPAVDVSVLNTYATCEGALIKQRHGEHVCLRK